MLSVGACLIIGVTDGKKGSVMRVLLLLVLVTVVGAGVFYHIRTQERREERREEWRRKEEEAQKLEEERIQREQREKADAREKERARDEAIQLLQSYGAREEMYLQGIIDEAKIKCEMVDVDLKSFSDEMESIDRSVSSKSAVAKKQNNIQRREQIERVKALLDSAVLKRLAQDYGFEDFAALGGRFKSQVEAWAQMEERVQSAKNANREDYYKEMKDLDSDVERKILAAKQKLTASESAISTRVGTIEKSREKATKELEKLRKDVERLRANKMKSPWQERQLKDAEMRLQVEEEKLARQKEVAALASANLLHMEATIAESRARNRGDIATMEKAERDSALDKEEMREKTYALLAEKWENDTVGRLYRIIKSSRAVYEKSILDAEKRMKYLRKSIQNVEFMDAEDIAALKKKIAEDSRKSINEGLQTDIYSGNQEEP